MADTILNLPEYKPYAMRWASRINQFNNYRRYYDGTIYANTDFVQARDIYAKTRALFLFFARAVDLDVALIPGVEGAWALEEQTPEPIIEAQQLLYQWSRWAIVGDAWLEDGATLGTAMIKIVPEPEAGIVRIDRVMPETCMLIDRANPETGEAEQMALIIDDSEYDSEGQRFEYGEVITPTEIRTYRNGKPFGYNGNPDRYPNPLGFVPVLETQNDTEARPTFAKLLSQIDSVNELASYINDVIGRHVEPIWAAYGVHQPDKPLKKSANEIWFLPNPDARIEAVLAEIDVPGVLSFIEVVKDESKANLPELAFDDLRAKDQIATETLQVQLIELHAKIWKMRRHYDQGLIDAHIMAALAAGISGISDLSALLAPHDIDSERPVLPVNPADALRLEELELSLEQQRAYSVGDTLTAMSQPIEQATD